MIRELATEFVGHRQLSRSAGQSAWQEFLSRNSDETAQEEIIDLNNQWRSVRFYDLIFQSTGIDFYSLKTLEEARSTAQQQLGFSLEQPIYSIGAFALQLAKALIFPTLIQPTFVVDFPPEAQPFARRNGNSRTIAYFELFMDGARVAAGNDEINDPRQLEESFSDQYVNVAHRSPEQRESLCHALTCGQPPAASLQVSIERLIMLLCRVDDVRKIVYFPIEEMRG
jgi:lysyl-tRNA synthetase class 2